MILSFIFNLTRFAW